MNIVGKVTVNMKPVNTILTRLGVKPNGDVQRFVTNAVNQRITRYMPYRSGVLSTKLKHIKSSTEIEVLGPYARVMYYGKVMVDPVTGAAGFMTSEGWRSRKNVPKVESSRNFNFDTTKNPRAGPFWDRNLMAYEGDKLRADVQTHINRKKGSR